MKESLQTKTDESKDWEAKHVQVCKSNEEHQATIEQRQQTITEKDGIIDLLQSKLKET